MAPNKTPQTFINSIIQFIISNKFVHYQDIMEFTGLSRKTVNKYLNQIEIKVNSLDVKLVRKRGKGIFFVGDVNKVIAAYPKINNMQQSDISRKLDILFFLLKSKRSILIEDLADKFFVSRSTLERELNVLKKQFGLVIKSDSNGIYCDMQEPEVRKIMSNIIQKFWGQEIEKEESTGKMIRNFTVPDSLLDYINKDILKKSQEVLAEFFSEINVDVNEYQYQSILVHITIAIQRIKNGDYIGSDTFNGDIFGISKNTERLIDLLTRKFSIEIPNSEKSYLNIHIVAIEEGYVSLNGKKHSENELSDWLKICLQNYDETLIKNLTLHLKPALKRLDKGITIKNPYKNQIKTNFPVAFDLGLDLSNLIFKKYDVYFNEDEITYLALHFQSFIERSKVSVTQVSAVIVCSTGFGTAELLKQRINDKIPSLKVIDTLSVNELLNSKISADIVITTVPINDTDLKIFQVSPFLNDKEINLLQQVSKNIHMEKYDYLSFVELLHESCIFTNSSIENKEQAIIYLTKNMYKFGFIDSEMTESALNREKMASTVIDKIAIPHGDIKHVIKPAIGILTSKHGIQWGDNKVNTVFFIALNKKVEEKMDDIYSYFYDLIRNSKLMSQIANSNDACEVINLLKQKHGIQSEGMKDD